MDKITTYSFCGVDQKWAFTIRRWGGLGGWRTQELEGTVRLHAVRQTDSTSRLRLYTSAVELEQQELVVRETVKYQGEEEGGYKAACGFTFFFSRFSPGKLASLLDDNLQSWLDFIPTRHVESYFLTFWNWISILFKLIRQMNDALV